jgi:multiple sugar transport system permease protein
VAELAGDRRVSGSPLLAAQGGRRVARWQRDASPYLFVVPALAMMLFVLGAPILSGVTQAFFEVLPSSQGSSLLGFAGRFVGVDNFVRQLENQDLYHAFFNTLFLTVASVALGIIIGLGVALLLNEPLKGRLVYRLLILSPWTVMPVVAGDIWRRLLDSNFGVVQDVMLRIGYRGAPLDFLSDPRIALWTITLVTIWLRLPFTVVVLLAALQHIPNDQYEAAAVDGAGMWARFRHVTLPNLGFTLGILAVLESIASFKTFDLVAVMTGGGPAGATEVLSTFVYRLAFNQFRFGDAAALSLMMTIIMLAFVMFYVSRALTSAAETR